MEQNKRRAEGRDGVETDESVSKAEVADFANGDRDIPRADNGENMNEMEISSEFSFTSGYRSSELLSDQSSEELEEELEEEQGKIMVLLWGGKTGGCFRWCPLQWREESSWGQSGSEK